MEAPKAISTKPLAYQSLVEDRKKCTLCAGLGMTNPYNIEGGKYQSEDVLEIVKVRPDQAYVRVHLLFFNGHQCSVYGIAKVEGDELVYRTRRYNDQMCVLTLRRNGNRVVFGDKDSACHDEFCGMRGIFEGQGFPLSSRRPIRYMKRLLKSREYAEAIAERSKEK